MKPKEPPPGVKPPPVDAAGATAAVEVAVPAEDADGLVEKTGAACGALAGAPPKLKVAPVEAAALDTEAAAVNNAGCEEDAGAPGADMKLKPPP